MIEAVVIESRHLNKLGIFKMGNQSEITAS